MLITGDFNVHIDVPDDPDTVKLLDLLESFGLHQHVTVPMHKFGHTLDLIITQQSEHIVNDSPWGNRFISDHSSVVCSLFTAKPDLTVEKVQFRKLNSINLELFRKDLTDSELCCMQSKSETTLCSDNLNDIVWSYNKTLSALLESHAPLKPKVVNTKPKVPWYNEKISVAKKL